jgi:hypothetical protein
LILTINEESEDKDKHLFFKEKEMSSEMEFVEQEMDAKIKSSTVTINPFERKKTKSQVDMQHKLSNLSGKIFQDSLPSKKESFLNLDNSSLETKKIASSTQSTKRC